MCVANRGNHIKKDMYPIKVDAHNEINVLKALYFLRFALRPILALQNIYECFMFSTCGICGTNNRATTLSCKRTSIYNCVCVCVLMISVALSRKPQSNFTPMLLTVKGFPTKYNRFPYQYLCIHIRQMFRAFVNTLPTNICVYT